MRKACELSIKNLGLQYLDLYLLHFSMSSKWRGDVPLSVHDPTSDVFEGDKLEDTWKVGWLTEKTSIAL